MLFIPHLPFAILNFKPGMYLKGRQYLSLCALSPQSKFKQAKAVGSPRSIMLDGDLVYEGTSYVGTDLAVDVQVEGCTLYYSWQPLGAQEHISCAGDN